MFDQVVLREIGFDTRQFNHSLRDMSQLLCMAPASWPVAQPHHQFTVVEDPEQKKTVCLLEVNHALVDHISLNHIFQELSSLYEGEMLAHTASPFSLLIEHLANHDQEAAINYWRSLLSAIDPNQPEFAPCDSSGPGYLRQTPVPLRSRTKYSLARLPRYTPSIVLRLAWALVLWRRRPSCDACFGYVVSGRDVPLLDDADCNSVVGPCLNIMACRVLSIHLLRVQCPYWHTYKTNILKVCRTSIISWRMQHVPARNSISLYHPLECSSTRYSTFGNTPPLKKDQESERNGRLCLNLI